MQIATRDGVATERERDVYVEEGHAHTAHLLGRHGEESDGPEAFLVEFRPNPGHYIKPHFHRVAQFQVIVGGEGRLGKKRLRPGTFHFADAWTPYGPIVASDESRGIDFYTLRAFSRPGIWHMPGSKDKMQQRAGRNIAIEPHELPRPVTGVEQQTLIEPHPDGLAALLLQLAPNQQTTGPSPNGSAGQYYLVTEGSLHHDGTVLPSGSLIFVSAEDDPATVTAGANGADVFVLQCPVESTA